MVVERRVVNGLNACRLDAEPVPSSRAVIHVHGDAGFTVSWGMRVWRRLAGGAEIEITAGTPEAMVYNDFPSYTWALRNATWSCPRTQLANTDSIVVRIYQKGYESDTFTTEVLGATQLDAATWTVYYYVRWYVGSYPYNNWRYAEFIYGYNYPSRIENFRYSSAPSLQFADGFESGNFVNWTGTVVTPGETASVSNALAHHGVYGGRFMSNGTGGTERAYCYKTVKASGEVYAQGYFRVSTSGIVEEADRFYFIILAGSDNVAYAGWRKVDGVVRWCLAIKNGSNTVFAYSGSSPALNQWYCVELHWKKDAVNGLGDLWVNGVRTCSLSSKNTASYGDVTTTRFGLPTLYYCGPTTVYLDCVKVSTAYIDPEPVVTSFSVSPNPFSPNGDGSKDTTTINATFNVAVKWRLEVRNSTGTTIDSLVGTGTGFSAIWDGRDQSGNKIPDGIYSVRLSGTDLSGISFPTKSAAVTVDTKPPNVTSVSVSPSSFNPVTGQTTTLNYTLSESCYVTIKIYNSTGALKRTLLNGALQTSGPRSIVWNGKDSLGNVVPPGTYTIKIYVSDKAGNKATPYPIIKTVTVDTEPPTVTGVSVFPASFNPSIGQTTRINYTLSESCYVTIKIYNSTGSLKMTPVNYVLQASGIHSIVWNGKDSSSNIVPSGTYTIKIYVVDKAGNKATPYPIIKTVTVT
jgi:flagellar hook assembly protein FlgD